MSESKNVWKPLKEAFEKRDWPADRIENSVVPGMPDLVVSIRSSIARHFRNTRECFIELKEAEVEENGSVSLGLRREQFIWLRAARSQNRFVLLIARIGVGWFVFDTLTGFEMAKKSVQLDDLENEAAISCSTLAGLCDWLYMRSDVHI